MKSLIQASLAKSTWAKYNSGWNAFAEFEKTQTNEIPWPLSPPIIRNFVTWGLMVKKLQPATMESYLSAISMAHKLKGMEIKGGLKDGLTDMILSGASNLKASQGLSAPRASRRAVTLPLLKIIGSKLTVSSWSEGNRQTIWTACCIAFFGSARLGELLSLQERGHDPSANLLWRDIRLKPDAVLIHIKLPKSGAIKGEFIDLFKFEGENCCPVAALYQRKTMQMQHGLFSLDGPIFRLESGKNLTINLFNSILKDLLKGVIDYERDSVTAHSFRAGVASSLSRFPDLASSKDVQNWGRWAGGDYKKYARFHLEKRKNTFQKITKALLT